MPFGSELDILTFTTNGSWSANQLAATLRALDRLYLGIILARFLALETKQSAERIAREWRGPRFFFEDWERFGVPPPALWGQAGLATGAGDELIGRCLAEPSLFVEPSDELVVDRIQMASPGGFNLKGLGEPIRQLRELIKDLWYRNRHERKRAELALLRERLQLVSHFRLTEVQLQALTNVAIDEVAALKQVVTSKQLLLTDGEREGESDSEPAGPQPDVATPRKQRKPRFEMLPRKPQSKRRRRPG